jgi:hypothetical protein
MRPAAVLVRKDDADLLGDRPVLSAVGLDQPDQIVVVDDRDVALAGRHRLDLIGVAALRRARQVVDQAFRPRLGVLEAVCLDHRRDQRLIVDVGRRADADPAQPLRFGEILVGRDLARIDPILGVDDAP